MTNELTQLARVADFCEQSDTTMKITATMTQCHTVIFVSMPAMLTQTQP